jgi:hypothetical protein
MRMRADIELATFRVRRAEIIVLRQKKILLQMARRGDPTEMAEDLLATYERILGDYRVHLDRLLSKESPASL